MGHRQNHHFSLNHTQGSHKTKAVRVMAVVVIIFALIGSAAPTAAQGRRNRLPAPICALVGARVACYEAETAMPRLISAEGLQVFDFALSPDGEYVVYRTVDGGVWVGAVDQSESAQLDAGALPPAAVEFHDTTITWSPDGLGIAYVIATGVRVALPGASGIPVLIDFTDRLYNHLTFSPGGMRLAAQDVNRSWTVFSILSQEGLKTGAVRFGVVDRPGDAAWLDDNSLIAAPEEGGLLRLNVVEGENRFSTAWERAEGSFTKLVTYLGGGVRAFVSDPGDLLGQPVGISGEGAVTGLGAPKIDPRATWTAGGLWLVYITSGTPILIDPVTGGEDALDIQRVSTLSWGAPPTLIAGTLSMDADLFFLAPDAQGVHQVWEFPGDGQTPVRQMTAMPQSVIDYAISPDRRFVALTMGNRLLVVPLPGFSPTPTPVRATPIPDAVEGVLGSRLLAVLENDEGSQPAWRSDGAEIAYLDGDSLYLIEVTGSADVLPTTPRRLARSPENAVFLRPAFSPDRGRVMVQVKTLGSVQPQTLVVNTTTLEGQFIVADRAQWGLNALFYVRGNNTISELAASDGSTEAVLARSPYPIVTLQPLPGSAPGAAGQRALYLRDIGWWVGPPVIQLMETGTAPDLSTVQGQTTVLSQALISPSGRFAAGLGLANNGKILKLSVVDLQNGRKFVIQSANEASALIWVR